AGTSSVANVTMTVLPNPVTDVVTISKAGQLKTGNLSANGTLSLLNDAFAPSVEIFAGTANTSHTGCAGAALGSAPVSRTGAWSFTKRGAARTSSLCVESPNGGVADAPL
ncbi:MAG TPA: hypothetical protein VF104_10055, partial [Burkholderiales bacterium]